MMAMGGAARQKLTDPRRGADLRAQQSVRGKGTGKREHVRDEHQCLEEEARGQDGQGSRPKDGRLNVEQGRGDHVAEKHDGVDHRDERIDLAQANFGQRRQNEEGGEQQADEHETEPDFLPVRRCIEQPQMVLRHELFPQNAGMFDRIEAGQPSRQANANSSLKPRALKQPADRAGLRA